MVRHVSGRCSPESTRVVPVDPLAACEYAWPLPSLRSNRAPGAIRHARARSLPGARVALCGLLLGLLARGAGADDPSYTVTTGPRVDATFRAPDASPISLSFRLDGAAPRSAMAEFGYSDSEVKAIYASCAGCDASGVLARVDQYYRDHGFIPEHLSTGSTSLSVDVPASVRRNGVRVRPVASALQALAQSRGYTSDEELGVAVAFVQGAMEYRRPPNTEAGRQIVGFYPAPRALEVGAGDCDTKSALLAAVVSNFSAAHMVGVHVPGHYLVGIDRVPRSGDAFVRYQGEPYVLIEASGPALLPPGVISPSTQSALKAMSGVRIDWLF